MTDNSISTGPQTWAEHNPACNGTRQSPIDLVFDESSKSNNKTKNSKIVFSPDYFKAMRGNWTNDGYLSNPKIFKI